jgi:hypothetical protein
MTVNLDLSPEREAALKAQARARGLTVEQWLLQLAEQSAALTPPPDAAPIWNAIAGILRAVPPGEFAKLPRDTA